MKSEDTETESGGMERDYYSGGLGELVCICIHTKLVLRGRRNSSTANFIT